ncbi:hypothetical protein D3C81_1143890 [compost metagenome]
MEKDDDFWDLEKLMDEPKPSPEEFEAMQEDSRSKITYKSWSREHTVSLGYRSSVSREHSAETGALLDVCIERAIAIDCPLAVRILVRSNGDLDVWNVGFGNNTNVYWHITAGGPNNVVPTEAQRAAIERLQHNEGIYGNLGGNVGATVLRWAFGDEVADEAIAWNT